MTKLLGPLFEISPLKLILTIGLLFVVWLLELMVSRIVNRTARTIEAKDSQKTVRYGTS